MRPSTRPKRWPQLILTVVMLGASATGQVEPASALGMDIGTNRSTYQVGETITVTLWGDTSGAGAALTAYAEVAYGDPSLVDGLGAFASQDPITSFGGFIEWATGNPNCLALGCVVFNQLAGLSPLMPDPVFVKGVLQIPTLSAGTLSLAIDPNTLDWFGFASPPPPIEVTIVDPPPMTKISDTQGYLSAPGSPGTNPGGALFDGNQFGAATEGIGDLDRDGTPDVAVGASANEGTVFILFLNADGTVKAKQEIGAGTGGLTATLDSGDTFGADIALIHDVNGDGVQDLAVAAPNDDDGAVDAGALYILFLNMDGTVKAEKKISNLAGGLGAVNDAGDGFGNSPAGLGDLDGDGIPDVAVGSFLDNASGGNSGSLYILFLNADGTVKASQKITEGVGGFMGTLDVSDRFGSGVANLGDLNGDGRPELAVGARFDGSNDGGAVYLLSLNTNGTVHSQVTIESGANGFVGPTDSLDRFAWPARIGDLDGNGVGDLAVGAITDDDMGADAGAVWILFLTTSGGVRDERKLSLLPTLGGGDLFGTVTSVGDLDGDGTMDLVVGASRDDDGGADRGASYVLFMDGAAASCGNGVLDPVELCDDGNTSDGDSCPATCGLQAAATSVPASSLLSLLIMGVLLAGLARWRLRRAA